MSFKRIFSAGKRKEKQAKTKDEPPTTQEAIQKLRDTEEMLTKKTEYLEKKIEAETSSAKRNVQANRRAEAMQALKRRKRLERQLSHVDSTLSAIELQRETVENTHVGLETVKALDYGRKAMAGAHKQVGVDDIHDMMDDISDSMDKARDIDDVLTGRSSSMHDDIDEDELNAELEQLGLEDRKDVPDLPEVPTSHLPTRTRGKDKKLEKDEMKELEAWVT